MQHFDSAIQQHLPFPLNKQQQQHLQLQWQQQQQQAQANGHHAAPAPAYPLNGSTQDPSAQQQNGDAQPPPADPSKKRSTSDGYRERWIKRLPRKRAETWVSDVCSACEREGGGMLVCMGPCLRGFHPGCIGEPPVAPQDRGTWFCPECSSGVMKCFCCGEFSAGHDDPYVRKCSLGACGRFYHNKCVMTHPRTSSVSSGRHFRCPQHYCLVCERSGDGVDMVKCLRCPASFHSSCLPQGARRLRSSGKAIVCDVCAEKPLAPYVRPPEPNAVRLAVVLEEARQEGLQVPPSKKAKASRTNNTTANDAVTVALAAALERIGKAAAMAASNGQSSDYRQQAHAFEQANGNASEQAQGNGNGQACGYDTHGPQAAYANGHMAQGVPAQAFAYGASARIANGNGSASSDTDTPRQSGGGGNAAAGIANGAGSAAQGDDRASDSDWGAVGYGRAKITVGATAAVPAVFTNGDGAAAAGSPVAAARADGTASAGGAAALIRPGASFQSNGPSRTGSGGDAPARSKKPGPRPAGGLAAAAAVGSATAAERAVKGSSAAERAGALQAAGNSGHAYAIGSGACGGGVMGAAGAAGNGVKAEANGSDAGIDGTQGALVLNGAPGRLLNSSAGGRALAANLLQRLQQQQQQQQGQQQQDVRAASPQQQQEQQQQGGMQQILATLAKMRQLEQDMARNKAAQALPQPSQGPSSQELVQQLLACMTSSNNNGSSADTNAAAGSPAARRTATMKSTAAAAAVQCSDTPLLQMLRAAAVPAAQDNTCAPTGSEKRDYSTAMDVDEDHQPRTLLPLPPTDTLGQYVVRTAAKKSAGVPVQQRLAQQQGQPAAGPAPLQQLRRLQQKELLQQQQRQQQQDRQEQQGEAADGTLELLAAAAAAASVLPIRSLHGLSAPVLERALRQLTGDQMMAVLEHVGVLPDPESGDPEAVAAALKLQAEGPASFVLLLQLLQQQQRFG